MKHWPDYQARESSDTETECLLPRRTFSSLQGFRDPSRQRFLSCKHLQGAKMFRRPRNSFG